MLEFTLRKKPEIELSLSAGGLRNITRPAPVKSVNANALPIPENSILNTQPVSASVSVQKPQGIVVTQPTAKTQSSVLQTPNRAGNILPSTDNPESYARGLTAQDIDLTQNLSNMAARSTARRNRQTGLQFHTLLGQTGKGGLTPKASPTSTAWFGVMSDAEKTRAASIRNPVERGEFINSLGLNTRAVERLREGQDKTAAELESKPLQRTENAAGAAIAAYVQAGGDYQKRFNALDMLDAVGKRSSVNDLTRLDEQQRAAIEKFAQAGDYQAVADYFDNIEYRLRAKSREALVEKSKKTGYEHPVLSIVPEGTSNAFGGIPAIVDTVMSKLNETFTGKWTPIDPNSHVYDIVAASQAIQEGANERIEGQPIDGQRVGGIENPYLRGAARMGRSAASSALTNGLQLLAGGAAGLEGEALSNFVLGTMGFSAAGQSAYRDLKEGKTSGDALNDAIATGIIESLTEKVSVDRFIKVLPTLRADNAKQLAINFWNAVKTQAPIEGLEEVTGNILDQMWDISYSGEDSEFSRRSQAVLAQKILDSGDPEHYKPTAEDAQSAREQAFMDLFVTQSAEAFATAALSSFMMVGAPTVTNGVDIARTRRVDVRAGNQLKRVDGAVIAEINKGKLIPGSEAARLAEILDAKIDRTNRDTIAKSVVSLASKDIGKLERLNALTVIEALGDMTNSENPAVKDYATELAGNWRQLQNRYLTYEGFRRILESRDNNTLDESVLPTASDEAKASAAQAEQTQEENPDAVVLSSLEQALRDGFGGMTLRTVRKRAAILQRIIDGKDVTTAQFNSVDPANPTTKRIFSELTGVQFAPGLTGDALYNEYRKGARQNVEAVMDKARQDVMAESAQITEPVPVQEPTPVSGNEQQPQAPAPVETPPVVRQEAPPSVSQPQPTQEEPLPVWDERLADEVRRETGKIFDKGGQYGKGDVAYTPGNQPVNFRYAVVPVESLIISNDEYGTRNPDYPKELQPRNRERMASQRQIQDLAKTLNPFRLSENREAKDGAPIVRNDGVVIGGNGRSAAIRAAYQTGHGAGYENFIRGNAGNFGLDPSQIPNNPVLVRVVADENTNWAKLAKDLNVATTHAYSPAETALSDTERIEDIIPLLDVGENGNMNTSKNADFINAFVSMVPQSEQDALLDEYGDFSKTGLQRATNAVVAYVYGDTKLLSRFTESAREDMKNITNALVQTAPKLAQLKLDMQSGDAYNVPVIETILDGLNLYAESKRNQQTVQETADQASLDTHYDANSVLVAEVIEHFKLSAVGLRGFLTDLADAVRDFGSPNQPSLMGGAENANIESALDTAAARTNERKGTNFQRGEGHFGGQSVSGTENPGMRTESEQRRPDGEGVSRSNVEDVGEGISQGDRAKFSETAQRFIENYDSDLLRESGLKSNPSKLAAYIWGRVLESGGKRHGVKSIDSIHEMTLEEKRKEHYPDYEHVLEIAWTSQQDYGGEDNPKSHIIRADAGIDALPRFADDDKSRNITIKLKETPDAFDDFWDTKPTNAQPKSTAPTGETSKAQAEEINGVTLFRSVDEFLQGQDGDPNANRPIMVYDQSPLEHVLRLSWNVEAGSKKMALINFANKFAPALESLVSTDPAIASALDTVRRIQQDYQEAKKTKSRNFRWESGYAKGQDILSIEALREKGKGTKGLYQIDLSKPVSIAKTTTPAPEHRDYSKWENEFTFGEQTKAELDRLPDAEEKLDKLAREIRKFKAEVTDFFGTIADAPVMGEISGKAKALAEYWREFFKRTLDSPYVFVNDADNTLDWNQQLVAGTRDFLVQRVFNGLTSSYPDFIYASFTLDLDNVTIKSMEGARLLFDEIRAGHFDDIRKHFTHGMPQTIVDSIDKMYSFENAYQNAKQATIESLYGYVNELKDSEKKRAENVLLKVKKGNSITEAERIHNAIMNGAEATASRNVDGAVAYFLKTDGAKKPERLSKVAYDFALFTEDQRSQAMDAERNPTITASLSDANTEEAESALPEGVGAASYAFNNDAVAAQLEYNAAKYGTIEGQEKIDERGRVDNVYTNEIPTQINDETYVGRNIVTQMSSLGIAKERIGDYEEGTVEGYFNENPLTHKDMLDKADATMKRLGGVRESQKYLTDMMNKMRPLSLEDIALFQKTLVQLSHTEMSTQDYLEFAAEFSHYASYLGHGLNLLKLLKKIDPDYEMNTYRRTVRNINRGVSEKKRGKARNQDLPDMEKAEQAVEEAREEVLDDMKHPEKAERNQRRNNVEKQRGQKGAKRGKGETGNQPVRVPNITDIEGQEVIDGMPRKAKQEIRDHGFPVPYWMRDAGEIVADDIIKRVDAALKDAPKSRKQQSVSKTIMRDMLKFADDYVHLPKRPGQSRTAVDRLRDFFLNREHYEEAWKSAQDSLRVQYDNEIRDLQQKADAFEAEKGNGAQFDDSRLKAYEASLRQLQEAREKRKLVDAFLHRPLGWTSAGENVTNPVTRGVLTAILSSDQTIKPSEIAMRTYLTDSNAIAEQIFRKVSEQIQEPYRDMEGNQHSFSMSEQDATEVRNAIKDYVFGIYAAQYAKLSEPDKHGVIQPVLQKRLNSGINAALREIGVKMSDIIREGNPQKEAVARRIADMLIQKYGVSQESAQRAGEIVIERFNEQVAERSRETLEKMFREKKTSGKLVKNRDRILKQFSNLANLGAFSSGDYAEQAAAKIFGYNYIRVNQSLIDEFRNAQTDEQRDKVIGQIQQDIADQIESTLYEKYTALRYLGMLGSLKTIFMRNPGGNLFFQPIVGMKNVIAAGIESGAKALGIDIGRTRTATYRVEDYQAWFDDFGSIKSGEASKVRKLILQGGKYSDNRSTNEFMRGIQDRRTIFGRNNDIVSKTVGRGLEVSRRAVTDWMDLGDAFFARHTYAATAARYLKAQGVTFKTASNEQLEAAREIAVREAAEATYRDNNQFAEAFSRLGRNHGDNKVAKALSFLLEGVLPFRKTPANIAVRAVEYSPFGIFKTLYDTITKFRGSNKISGNDLINEWAKLLTGAGLFLLGAFLKRYGMFGVYVTGTGALDERKKRGFMRLQGWQEYSLKFKIGNEWRCYNADWLAPEAIPVFLGANFAEALEDKDLNFWNSVKVAMTVADPLVNMSTLSGLNKALDEAATYGKDDEYALVKIVTNAFWSNFTQAAVPQIVKQGIKAIDGTRKTTFVDRNKSTPPDVQRLIGGIPYTGYHRMDYIDEWGRTQESYKTTAGNAVAQILSPAYQSIQEIDTDVSRMENDLMSLYGRTKDSGVLPSTAKTYFTLNGQRKDMTQAEYISYATQRGQTALLLAQQLTGSDAYKALNDNQRISAVKSVYDYASQMAKVSIWGDADNPELRYTPDSWVDEANALTQNGIAVHEYIIAKAIKSKATSATIQDSDGESVKVKVSYRKLENGTYHEKTSEVGSASVQAALEIRRAVKFSGSDAEKKYKLLFKNLDIAEAVQGKNEQWLEKKLGSMQEKGSSAP